MKLPNTLDKLPIEQQRVFLRADLNVSLQNDTTLGDYKLQAIIPTLHALQKQNAKIILATHIGRPEHEDESLSTKHLVPWFRDQGLSVVWAHDLEKAAALRAQADSHEIILLENLRFFPQEKSGNAAFAQQLADLADVYVNDAFGILHRTDTSIHQLPKEFEPEKRGIGLLVQQELRALQVLIDNETRPFVLILGGGKPATKIPLIAPLLERIDTLLLCPAVSFTFDRALKHQTGRSLVCKELVDNVQHTLDMAQKLSTKIVLPVDYLVALNEFTGPLEVVSANELQAAHIGISIGPKTGDVFAQHIKNAARLFFNGVPGDLTRTATLEGARKIMQAFSINNGYRVIGGGDTVRAARQLGYPNAADHYSTGGGSALTLLASKELPGLVALMP